MPGKVNFIIKANGHWIRVWQFKSAGAPLDLTGYTFELEVKRKRGAAEAKYLNLSLGAGITIVDAAEGKISIEIPPDVNIVSNQTYVYDFLAIFGGKAYPWLEGQMVFEPGVSYMGS